MRSSPASDNLWNDAGFRKLWISLLLSGFAGQVGALALSLTAALLLGATATQIGLLGAIGTIPFVLFMLPAGVWLDRVRKLPAYVTGEMVMVVALATIPIAWSQDRLSIELLYAISFVGGCVSVVSGTAGQVVLTQLVRREQLVEAHAKNRIAASIAEVAGPGVAGVLVKAIGAPLAIAVNCGIGVLSIAMLVSLRLVEHLNAASRVRFWSELRAGIAYVWGDRLLRSMALAVSTWQVFQTCAMVTQVLFATRQLGLDAAEFGLCLTVAGGCAVAAGSWGHRIAARFGPGPSMIGGVAVSGFGWAQLALAPAGVPGIFSYVVGVEESLEARAGG